MEMVQLTDNTNTNDGLVSRVVPDQLEGSRTVKYIYKRISSKVYLHIKKHPFNV